MTLSELEDLGVECDRPLPDEYKQSFDEDTDIAGYQAIWLNGNFIGYYRNEESTN